MAYWKTKIDEMMGGVDAEYRPGATITSSRENEYKDWKGGVREDFSVPIYYHLQQKYGLFY